MSVRVEARFTRDVAFTVVVRDGANAEGATAFSGGAPGTLDRSEAAARFLRAGSVSAAAEGVEAESDED